MTAELCSAELTTDGVAVLDSAEFHRGTSRSRTSMVERVAAVVSGISVIGHARNALNAAGWTATITANRITVDEGVLAQLIPAKMGIHGFVDAEWVVYPRDGEHPVCVVGAGR